MFITPWRFTLRSRCHLNISLHTHSTIDTQTIDTKQTNTQLLAILYCESLWDKVRTGGIDQFHQFHQYQSINKVHLTYHQFLCINSTNSTSSINVITSISRVQSINCFYQILFFDCTINYGSYIIFISSSNTIGSISSINHTNKIVCPQSISSNPSVPMNILPPSVGQQYSQYMSTGL